MVKKIEGNIVKCINCGSYLEYEDSDVKTEERGYGVGTYAGETYMAKLITCPKCGRLIEL